jgi:phage gp36-like protein
MPYCTKQNLIDRFDEAELIQLTDGPLGTIDDDVINAAIADADAEINSYLTAYDLPLAVVPVNFLRIAADIARYYLYEDQPTETVTKRYDDAIKYLMMIAKGTIILDTGIVLATAGHVVIESSDNVFGIDDYGKSKAAY